MKALQTLPWLCVLFGAISSAEVTITSESPTNVAIANDQLALRFDLAHGTWDAIDLADGTVCLRDASWSLDGRSPRESKSSKQWKSVAVSDEIGTGKTLTILGTTPEQPEQVLQITVYENEPFVVMTGGLHNTTKEVVQLKTIHPVAGGVPFPDLDKQANFRIVDGFGGGEPLEWGKTAYTPVHKSNAVASRNNLLMTFGKEASDVR